MSPSSFFVLPFALQGLATLFDEFYFHHKRGLPQWERLGHPLDTLTVLGCYVFLATLPPSSTHLSIYIGLATFSCLFVTKDEAIHLKYCSAAENWLHALLFLLHPLAFIAAGLIWYSTAPGELSFLMELRPILQGQAAITSGFLIYQIGYWNFYAKTFTKPISDR